MPIHSLTVAPSFKGVVVVFPKVRTDHQKLVADGREFLLSREKNISM